jgi:CheY-like chemotaxis protein
MNISHNQHVILLYKSDSSRDLTAAKCINQGLKEGQLCIYASVNACEPFHLTKISSLIEDYKDNLNKRNLLIIDLKPFYDSALVGGLAPFKKLEIQLQYELKKREDANKNKDVLIIADCADNLFVNQHFDQCEMVENWWHNIYVKYLQQYGKEQWSHFTVICPYQELLLDKNPFNRHKHQISHNHSITIDTQGHAVSGYTNTGKKEPTCSVKSVASQVTLTTRIIVAEPDSDLRLLYSLWLHSAGFKDITITDSGRKCIDELLKLTNCNEESKSSNNKPQQDIIIILDMHIKDISSIQVAKEIVNKNLCQQIIFTTTTIPSDIIRQEISSAGLDNYDVLIKPFELSKLSALVLPSIIENN